MTTDLGMPVVPEWLKEKRLGESIDEHTPANRRYQSDDKANPYADRKSEGSRVGHDYVLSREKGDDTVHNLTRDVAFNKHEMNDGHHVSPSDNGIIQVGTDGIIVELVQGIDEEAFKRTLSAATRATIGIDIKPKRELCPSGGNPCHDPSHASHVSDGEGKWYVSDPLQPDKDWEEMLKGGLQTALETQVIVFAVSGVSRTMTHQAVRSRRAAFHQQSQRASYAGDFPEVRMPESVWVKPHARDAFLAAVDAAHAAYRIACEEGVSYQDARFALPEGTTNFILLEYPVREFLNVYAYRACSMFQWEIVAVMRKCRDVLVAAHPFLEPYVKISCEKPQRCTFQGWEVVEGQCDLPWAKEELRTFQPTHHRIGGK